MVEEYHAVLVVEDEPLIRFYECELAEEAGFLALHAANADEAIKELEGPIDVEIMVTDVNMPGSMDGLALAAFVRQRWPQIKIIVSSAHAENAARAEERDFDFVPKPFAPNQLIAALAA